MRKGRLRDIIMLMIGIRLEARRVERIPAFGFSELSDKVEILISDHIALDLILFSC